jgi:hypothetical protein
MGSAAYRRTDYQSGGGMFSSYYSHDSYSTRQLSRMDTQTSYTSTGGMAGSNEEGGALASALASSTAVITNSSGTAVTVVAGDGSGGCCGPDKCTTSRVKACLKTFMGHLFSHVGLCALVIGYAIMGAFIFVYLEKENELATRVKVGDERTKTLNELYNITGESGSHSVLLT